MLGANVLHWKSAVGVLGVLRAIAALLGLVLLAWGNRRMGIAFGVVLVLQAAATVMYFNIHANFFRPFDRHYLPVCVTITVLMTYGLAATARALASNVMNIHG